MFVRPPPVPPPKLKKSPSSAFGGAKKSGKRSSIPIDDANPYTSLIIKSVTKLGGFVSRVSYNNCFWFLSFGNFCRWILCLNLDETRRLLADSHKLAIMSNIKITIMSFLGSNFIIERVISLRTQHTFNVRAPVSHQDETIVKEIA